jgi:hypothetical protein
VLLVPQVFQRVKKDKALLKPNQAPYQVQVKIKWIQEIRKANQENQEKDKVNHNHKDRATLKEMLLDKDKVKQENHKALEAENHQEKVKALVMEKVKEKAKVRDKVQVHQVEAEEVNHQAKVQDKHQDKVKEKVQKEMVNHKEKHHQVQTNPHQVAKVERHQEVPSNPLNNNHF